MSLIINNFVKSVNIRKTLSMYRFKQDNGEPFRGRTFIVSDLHSHLYIMFDANNVAYWVEFTDSDYENNKTLSSIVRLGKIVVDYFVFLFIISIIIS